MNDPAYQTAKDLPYRPSTPASLHRKIGLIGCGGVTSHHLTAYRRAGYAVSAVCDVDLSRAEARRDEFFPEATAYSDFEAMLANEQLDVVDVSTHPAERVEIIEAALLAGAHVLSQKPFVLDLDVGVRLCDLADRVDRRLAVNQNGRWAPHYRWSAEAVRQGLIGELCGAHLSVHWDHSWVRGTPFESIKHLILYDYAIHWFDLLHYYGLGEPKAVYATATRSKSQTVAPPLLAQAHVEYESAQASLAFDGHCPFGPQDRTFLTGSEGSIFSVGPGSRVQTVTLSRDGWSFTPRLEGSWFPDGFHGTMAELLASIEQDRRPEIDARRNLDSLALCFAAVASAEQGRPVRPGEVRRLNQIV